MVETCTENNLVARIILSVIPILSPISAYMYNNRRWVFKAMLAMILILTLSSVIFVIASFETGDSGGLVVLGLAGLAGLVHFVLWLMNLWQVITCKV